MKLSKPLTWAEVAKEYNRSRNGLPAQVLEMKIVFERLASREGFFVDPKEGTIHKILEEE